MKFLLSLFLMMSFIIIAGCVGGLPNTIATSAPSITQASGSQPCVKIIKETFADSSKWAMSEATIKNNCGDVVEGRVLYISYEGNGVEYRGFIPKVSTPFTLANSEEKIISTMLPDNWFTETVAVARSYGHGIVASYDVKIFVDKIGVDKPRAGVVSEISGESKTLDGSDNNPKIKLIPCRNVYGAPYSTGWGDEC